MRFFFTISIHSSVRCTIDGLCICFTCEIFGMSSINKDPPGPGGNLYFKKRKPKRVPEWCRRLGDVSFQFPFNEKFHRGTFRFFFAESSLEPRSESLGDILTFQTSSSLYLSLAIEHSLFICFVKTFIGSDWVIDLHYLNLTEKMLSA